MRKLEDCRITQVLVEGVWQNAHWEQLQAGDIVRLLPPPGKVDPELSYEACFVKQDTALHVDYIEKIHIC